MSRHPMEKSQEYKPVLTSAWIEKAYDYDHEMPDISFHYICKF